MADLVDHAFDHALVVTRDPGAALEVTVTACSRAWRSRPATLAQARHLALGRAAPDDPTRQERVPSAAVSDLPSLAVALAGGRPARERAIVDLATRHGLDRGGLGRALGLPPARAAALATEVIDRWERELGPVLLAWLGPGDCDDLATLITEPHPDDVTEDAARPGLPRALALGPTVAAHVESCSTCSDRLRACASMRDLLGQVVLEAAPDEVRRRVARTRRGVAAPAPPIDERPRFTRRLAAAGVAALALAGALIALRMTRADDVPGGTALAALPRTNRLVVERTVVRPGDLVTVRNSSSEPLRWRAEADVGWLSVVPAAGHLAPGAQARLVTRVAGVVPEGAARGSLRITGDEGSATRVLVETIVERSPLVAAVAVGCAVTATVEDDGALTAVVLVSRVERGAPRTVAMEPGARGWLGLLPRSDRPMAWWVEASDARGNQGRSANQVARPGACALAQPPA